MVANDTQVGGNHYRSEYQHWDMVKDVGFGYLEAQISRYVSRWRKKEGLTDLQKALHYLDKLEEQRDRQYSALTNFMDANDLSPLERRALYSLLGPTIHDLVGARNCIGALAENADRLVERKPVPLTEENHHADRA